MGNPATRCRALAALLADPEVRRGIGSAWPLYMMLVLEWGGTAAGTRDQIGERMGEDGRNVGNWVAALEQAGIAKVERDGRKMTVELAGDHMAAAMAPDGAAAETAATPKPVLDERHREVLDLMDRAKAMGGEAEVRIVVKAR